MSTRFSNLAEDCVQLIFDRIPTQNLLQIRRVSRAWQRNQQLNCRARKSLIILQGENALRRFTNHIYNEPFIKHNIDQDGNPKNYKLFIDQNRIHISPNNGPTMELFSQTFPHLHTLIVSTDCTKSSFLQWLTPLIGRYSSTLVTLQMYFDGEHPVGKYNKCVSDHLTELIIKLNSLTSLRHLTFDITDWSMSPRIGNIDFITRIKEFYFDLVSVTKTVLWRLEEYEKKGKLDQLTRVYSAHHNTDFFESLFKDIDDIPLPNLYAFSPFERRCYKDNQEELSKIVSKFVSLTTFRCVLERANINSLTKLTTILSPLTKLVHLYLDIRNLPSVELLNPNSTQLASVKALDLYFDKPNLHFLPTFYQTQVEPIVQCFPSLQSIWVSTNSDDRTYKSVLDKEEPVQQFFDSLKVAYGRPSLSTKYFE